MKESTAKKYELVFVPSPGISHLVPTVEFAQTLLDTNPRFSITILTMNTPFSPIPPSYTDSFPQMRFVELNRPDSPPPPPLKHTLTGISEFIDHYKPHSHHAITQLIATELDPNSVSLAALVLDMFTTTMVDIADELGIPSYVYYTSGVASLGLFLHLHILDSTTRTDYKDELTHELEIPSFKNSVPSLALPPIIWSRGTDDYKWYLYHGRRIGGTQGVIVNSFYDLEPYAIDSFGTVPGYPRVYSVGPVLDLAGRANSDKSRTQQNENIMKWLDKQPTRSVVFLCFGSRGTFDAEQAKEIGNGLERSGHRFLWSVRGRDPSTPVEELVPDGFVERTAERGMVVCGWVPQVAVLGHGSVGCFVSHCGWNSILESVWFGVPILTWPLYAEQHLNAFLLVRELGLSVELNGYCGVGEGELVMADEVGRGVRRVMEGECEEVKKRVEEMKEKSRRALMEGGSSVVSMKKLIEDLMGGQY